MRSSGRLGPLDRRGFLLGCGTLAAGLSGCRAPRVVQPGTAEPVSTEPLGEPPIDPVPATRPTIELGSATGLPIPDYSRVMRSIVGLRPYREGTPRIELERSGSSGRRGRPIVHAYGHGGAGITLAWGTAFEVRDALASALPGSGEVAVLGAGVIGLTTALTLVREGYRVSIYAERFTPNTTSDVAGGQWSPSLVATGRSIEEQSRFDRVMRRSYRAYEPLIGGGWGVSRRNNYVAPGYRGGLNKIPADLVVRRELEQLPFPGGERAGRVFETLLIEPPIFLRRLMNELSAAGVRFTERRFASRSELDDLPQAALVNALGLGAGKLFDDSAVLPIRGQLILLEPQDLPYLLSFNDYIFPRADAVVLGGTVRRGNTDRTPSERASAAMLTRHRRFFGLST